MGFPLNLLGLSTKFAVPLTCFKDVSQFPEQCGNIEKTNFLEDFFGVISKDYSLCKIVFTAVCL